MNRIIVILILICYAFANPAFASLSWTCPNCGETFYFDDRDYNYMQSWKDIHLNACRGGGSSSYDSSSSTYHGRPSFEGSLLIGGLAGGILGGVFGLAFGDMVSWGFGGAIIGAGLMGLLWWASEPPSVVETYSAPAEQYSAPTQPDYSSSTYSSPSNYSDTSVVDLSDKTSDVVDINVVRGVDISNVTVRSQVDNPAQFKYDMLSAYAKTFNERIQTQNDTAQMMIESLNIKEVPSPIKNISNLLPGDVILIAPNGTMSSILNKVDRWASNNSGSTASHTATYLGEKYGKRFYLNNTPETGPVIMEEKDFLKEYGGRGMNVATLVGQPLSQGEGDELWKGAKELAKAGGYGIKALPAANGNDNMVCSEASRWLLLRAGRYIPETKGAIKKPFVTFSPADFYEDQQYFIVHKLGMNK